MTDHTFQFGEHHQPHPLRVFFDGVVHPCGGSSIETLLIYSDAVDTIEIVAFHVERNIEAPRLYIDVKQMTTGPEIKSKLRDIEVPNYQPIY